MKLEGERTLPGRPEQVWEMLLDPDVLVAAIPGCQQLDRVGEDQYQGKIEAKVGSVESRYDTTFKITEKDPPNSYRLKAEGQGSAGFVNADAMMRMKAADGDGTVLNYDIDAQVGGRIAQVGQRMVRATASAMLDKGFNDLRDRIRRELQPASARRDGAAAAQPSNWDRLKKRLRELISMARAFLEALLVEEEPAREASSEASSQQRAAASSGSRQASGKTAPAPPKGQRASGSPGDTSGMAPPPSASSGGGGAKSTSASDEEDREPKKTKNENADTSGMPPPPGAS